MDAQEFINFEFEFDLNNPYEPTDEDIIDSLTFEDQQNDLDEDMVDCDDVVQQVGLDVADRALATQQTFLEQQQEFFSRCEEHKISSEQSFYVAREKISPDHNRFFF